MTLKLKVLTITWKHINHNWCIISFCIIIIIIILNLPPTGSIFIFDNNFTPVIVKSEKLANSYNFLEENQHSEKLLPPSPWSQT